MSLDEGTSDDDSEDLCQQSDATDDWQLQMEASEGLVAAVGKLSHTPLWKHQVDGVCFLTFVFLLEAAVCS